MLEAQRVQDRLNLISRHFRLVRRQSVLSCLSSALKYRSMSRMRFNLQRIVRLHEKFVAVLTNCVRLHHRARIEIFDAIVEKSEESFIMTLCSDEEDKLWFVTQN